MKKRTREQWQELLVQQEASGLSAVAFCQQHDLCPKYFSLRRKQLMKNNGEVETGFVLAQVEEREPSDVMTTSLIIHCNTGQFVVST